MHANTEKLRKLMTAHNLKAKDVAKLLGRSEQTVRIWRVTKEHRVIPNHQLELLELKLQQLRDGGGEE